jgi:hypothetical protein
MPYISLSSSPLVSLFIKSLSKTPVMAKYSMVIGNIIGNKTTMTTFLIPLNIT